MSNIDDFNNRFLEVMKEVMKELAFSANKVLFYVPPRSPEEQARIDELNRTYVPPPITPQEQLWTDWISGTLTPDSMSVEQMKCLLTLALEEVKSWENHEC